MKQRYDELREGQHHADEVEDRSGVLNEVQYVHPLFPGIPEYAHDSL